MAFRKKIYAAAGYSTTFFGPGRKEFNPEKPMASFETYLKEAADGVLAQVANKDIDEGVIANFMAPRFIKQANLPGFLPSVVPSLLGKPCTGVEGACGSGGRAIATAVRNVLSDAADTVFVLGFELQNTMKSIYGADVLAGAAYYQAERKGGCAHFFPGIFGARAGAYYETYGYDDTRKGLAKWYEQAILNARKNPKAQEYHNSAQDLFALGMTQPDAKKFIPNLNLYDCSKISDGAAGLIIASEEGLKKLGIDLSQAIEIVAVGAAEGDITKPPPNMTVLTYTEKAAQNALQQAGVSIDDLALLEIHDCFSITGLLSLEALGFAEKGKGAAMILDGQLSKEGRIPTNPSGGLCGFGHPVGASGVRMLVDLLQQFTKKAPNQMEPRTPYGMLVSMGGNDITVTSVIVKGNN
ncbi:MAG: hypothetical protein Q8K75_04205 [Chlamydiales bacterium]|nr:hypothetical protein [Chlamydiales bacterium]